MSRHARMLSRLQFFSYFLILAWLPAIGQTEEPDTPFREVIESASSMGLASDPQWLALLHYAPNTSLISPPSRVSGADFFLSSTDRRNPQTELEATLLAFGQMTPLDDSHPQCRFPARYAWLRDKLQLPDHGFPQVDCQRYRTWSEGLAVEGATLIFPGSFLNNPASAFGHTFLRLDQRRGDKRTDLLAYAADYAARTSGESALVYAAKGVFGGFDGYYTVAPFHKKVDQYSDLENRDIWEYELALSENELSMLVAHLWELRDVPLSYFYFDENCSYHILALLDVARPDLALVTRSPYWVMPVDTVRMISTVPGLVTSTRFRSSAATTLRARLAHSDKALASLGRSLANDLREVDKLSLLSLADRAAVLDIAIDFNRFERLSSRDELPDAQRIAFDLLKSRSELSVASSNPDFRPDVRPDEGHASAMMSLGVGRFEHHAIGEFQFRPALHALSDRPGGYLPGNQLQFLDTGVRFSDDEGVKLQRLTLLDIAALTPRDDFFSPLSWRIGLAGSRRPYRSDREPFMYTLDGGGGFTYALTDRLVSYTLIEADITAAGALEGDYRVTLGPSLGAVYLFEQSFGLEFRSIFAPAVAGESASKMSASLSPRISLSKNEAIRFETEYRHDFDQPNWTYILRFEHFFDPF